MSQRVDPTVRQRHKLRNMVQAVLLVVGMAGTLGVAAWLLFGGPGILWVLLLAAVTVAFQPAVRASWVLRMYGAVPLPPAAAPQVHRWVRALARRARLPAVPALFYVRSPMMNAMAVGRREEPALCVTDGLLRHLTGRELVGVLAHEISHIRSNDLWIMSLSDVVARVTHGLAYAGMLALALTLPLTVGGSWRPVLVAAAVAFLPTVVTLLQLALSRSREYDADLEAAALTDDPEGLASALDKLERQEGRIWERIAVPHGRVPDLLLLRTHPPTAERVRRLLSLTAGGRRDRLGGDAPVPPSGYAPVRRSVRLRPPGIRW